MPRAELEPLLAVRVGQPLRSREVRRTVERLFATGRFADVVVRATDQPSGVSLEIVLSPVQRVVRLLTDGDVVLSRAELLAAARLGPGSEFYPERLTEAQAAVGRAYARRGYAQTHVTVSTTEVPGGVEVLLALDEGPPIRVADVTFQGETGLAEERLATAFALRPGQVLDRARLDPGLDALRALYRGERFFRARVDSPRVAVEGETAHVVVRVRAGPRIRFHVHGNFSVPDAVLLGVLQYDPTDPLDRPVIARLAQHIATYYRYAGFVDARVESEEVLRPDGQEAVVSFHVLEGRRLRVREIAFDGATAFPPARLRAFVAAAVRARTPEPSGDVHPLDDPLELEGRVPGPDRDGAPLPAADTVFVEEAYRDAAAGITALYKDEGFLSADAQLVGLDESVDRAAARVRFQVQEGVRTFVESVELRGLPATVQPPSFAGLQPGAPFTERALEEARGELLRRLGRESYLFAQVEAAPGLSPDGRTAEVVLTVTPGPEVRVGQVVIRGLSRTREELVRRTVRIRPGDPLDPEALYAGQRDLLLLGVFRSVAVQLIAPETVEPVKDVVIEARERPRVSGSTGVGYSLEDGPRILGEISVPNLFGRGLNFLGRAKVNYVGLSAQPLKDYVDASQLQGLNGIDFSLNGGLFQPRIYELLPALVGARFNLVGERIHRPSYFFSRISAILAADWTVTPWFSVTGQYQIENDLVRSFSTVGQLLQVANGSLLSLTRADVDRLRFPTGNFLLQSVGPTLTLDFRDDPANPHRGLLFSTTGELTRDISAERTDPDGSNPQPAHVNTVKLSGTLSGYVPLGSRAVLALSLRGGRIFPLDSQSETIPPKRFFLGGATSLRGFGEDALIPVERRQDLRAQRAACTAVIYPIGCSPTATALLAGQDIPSEGGELFTLGRAEVRFPGFAGFDFGVFVEAGNLWLSAKSYRAFELRPVAGFGIRYPTPVGPLALDLGFNLAPDPEINEQTFAVQFSVGLF